MTIDHYAVAFRKTFANHRDFVVAIADVNLHDFGTPFTHAKYKRTLQTLFDRSRRNDQCITADASLQTDRHELAGPQLTLFVCELGAHADRAGRRVYLI